MTRLKQQDTEGIAVSGSIYIAGFDVFSPDAVEKGKALKKICAEYGFEGLYPLDNESSDPRKIFGGNLALINKADIICANLNDFRGQDMDSGTAFEIGYGYAKGKKIFGYTQDISSLRSRIGEYDNLGYSVEDFGMCVNLMIGCACINIIKGGFEDCIKSVRNQTPTA